MKVHPDDPIVQATSAVGTGKDKTLQENTPGPASLNMSPGFLSLDLTCLQPLHASFQELSPLHTRAARCWVLLGRLTEDLAGKLPEKLAGKLAKKLGATSRWVLLGSLTEALAGKLPGKLAEQLPGKVA